MLVIPLGLGTPVRRFPIATLTVAVLWFAVALLDHSKPRIAQGLLKAVAESGLKEASRELFVDYCQSRKGNSSACQRYAVLLWPGYPARLASEAASKYSLDLSQTVSELARADDVRRELTDCIGSRPCFAYRDIIWSFGERERQGRSDLASFGSYPAYQSALAQFKSALLKLCRSEFCLVQGNVTLSALLAAQARHADLWHLLGNLAAFLVFGIYVEQRTSRFLYLFAVLTGGTIGMAVHVGSSAGDSLALGGSANVSAVLGLFYAFYFRARMRLLVWLPRKLYRGTVFYAPVMWCMPLLFLLTDIAGTIDSGFGDLTATKVAHVAHLTGLGVGLAMGLAIVQWRRLPATMLYETEMADLRALAKTTSLPHLIGAATAMLKVNPDNARATELATHGFLKWAKGAHASQGALLGRIGHGFIARYLTGFVANCVRRGELDRPLALLAEIPNSMPLPLYLSRLGQRSALALGDHALAKGFPMVALRLYDFFLTQFPLSINGQRVEETAAELIALMQPTRANSEAATAFLAHHPHSPLKARLSAFIVNHNGGSRGREAA